MNTDTDTHSIFKQKPLPSFWTQPPYGNHHQAFVQEDPYKICSTCSVRMWKWDDSSNHICFHTNWPFFFKSAIFSQKSALLLQISYILTLNDKWESKTVQRPDHHQYHPVITHNHPIAATTTCVLPSFNPYKPSTSHQAHLLPQDFQDCNNISALIFGVGGEPKFNLRPCILGWIWTV